MKTQKTQKSQKRHLTQANIDKQLDRMIFLAAQQRLLPKIIYQYSQQHGMSKFVNQYRDSVKKIYTKQTAVPLKYNEQQAKTHRQKFREKIQKLINNQLVVDYLKPMKKNGKYIMTYKNHPLQKVQYPTRPQFQIFGDFSQAKFKTKFQDVFDDKLQYKLPEVLSPIRKEKVMRSKTIATEKQQSNSINKYILKSINNATTADVSEKKQMVTISPAPIIKLIARTKLDRSKLASPKPTTVLKKKPKFPKNINEQQLIYRTMIKIGGFNSSSLQISMNNISVTRQSIVKYFRELYGRPHRLVDFLQFDEVENYVTYAKKPQNLKFMPNEHIYFMAFLYYDSNNDGYICLNDLLRAQQIAKKCPLLLQDIQIVKLGASKIKYENKLKYFDLYRLSQITQTTYFNWLKKQEIKEQNPEDQHNQQLKQYMDQLNRRKIFLHYEGFRSLFKNQKPYIWYDILWRVSGIKYQGLRYQ